MRILDSRYLYYVNGIRALFSVRVIPQRESYFWRTGNMNVMQDAAMRYARLLQMGCDINSCHCSNGQLIFWCL